MQGFVHSFESLAAVDGEGLRCAVFLAGCPLRCVYCHNPDTWTKASAKPMEASELAQKISRYKPYFGATGGVTFSGGEPLVQCDFINDVACFLDEMSIGYAIDTSGAAPLNDGVKKAIDNASHVILDLKFWDDASYLKYTGMDMTYTLRILDYLEATCKNTWVRTVVVPGINDTEEKITRYIDCLNGKKCVKRYELLAFHTMGFHKYDMLGQTNPLCDTPALESEVRKRLQVYADSLLNI